MKYRLVWLADDVIDAAAEAQSFASEEMKPIIAQLLVAAENFRNAMEKIVKAR